MWVQSSTKAICPKDKPKQINPFKIQGRFFFLRKKKYLPAGTGRKGVKMKKCLLGLFCWYAYILPIKYEFFVTKIFESC